MEINNELKSELLSLDDSALKNVVNSVAKAAGISKTKLNISASDISKIRDAIMNATDKDAQDALRLIGGDEKAKDILNKAKNIN